MRRVTVEDMNGKLVFDCDRVKAMGIDKGFVCIKWDSIYSGIEETLINVTTVKEINCYQENGSD